MFQCNQLFYQKSRLLVQSVSNLYAYDASIFRSLQVSKSAGCNWLSPFSAVGEYESEQSASGFVLIFLVPGRLERELRNQAVTRLFVPSPSPALSPVCALPPPSLRCARPGRGQLPGGRQWRRWLTQPRIWRDGSVGRGHGRLFRPAAGRAQRGCSEEPRSPGAPSFSHHATGASPSLALFFSPCASPRMGRGHATHSTTVPEYHRQMVSGKWEKRKRVKRKEGVGVGKGVARERERESKGERERGRAIERENK